jgi:hypothetical protein
MYKSNIQSISNLGENLIEYGLYEKILGRNSKIKLEKENHKKLEI